MRHHDNGNRNISYTSESNENYQDYIPVPINNLSVKEEEEDDEVCNYEDIPTKELQYLSENVMVGLVLNYLSDMLMARYY